MDQQPNQQQPAGGEKKNTAMAIVAYILFFVPLLTDAKNDPFVKFHVKQGLVLFITSIIVNIAGSFLRFYFIGSILGLGVFVLFIVGIMNAINGKEEPLPVIGGFAKSFNF